MSLVEQYKIDCEYLAYFCQKNLKRDIMQLFSADATMFLKIFQHFFAHENKQNKPQTLLIIGPILFSVLLACPKLAQISYSVVKEKHNYIIFCSIKMAPCTTSMYRLCIK